MIVQISDGLWVNDRWIAKVVGLGDMVMVIYDHTPGSPFGHEPDSPWIQGEDADRLRTQWLGKVNSRPNKYYEAARLALPMLVLIETSDLIRHLPDSYIEPWRKALDAIRGALAEVSDDSGS